MQRLIIDPNQCNGAAVTLTAAQVHYLRRVLRLQVGDRFLALDGRGGAWQAEITATGAWLGAAIAWDTELPIAVTLIVALPKGPGFETIVRAGTELGASQFIPVLTARSLLQPSAHKQARWQRIAQEAAEQSERGLLPSVSAPLALASALEALDPTTGRYVCVARGAPTPALQAWSTQPLGDSVAIATGPEGGWTAAELELLQAQGFAPISLGRRVLRAVTAPLAALALLGALSEGVQGSGDGASSGCS